MPSYVSKLMKNESTRLVNYEWILKLISFKGKREREINFLPLWNHAASVAVVAVDGTYIQVEHFWWLVSGCHKLKLLSRAFSFCCYCQWYCVWYFFIIHIKHISSICGRIVWLWPRTCVHKFSRLCHTMLVMLEWGADIFSHYDRALWALGDT
jgi:hypothetical protein